MFLNVSCEWPLYNHQISNNNNAYKDLGQGEKTQTDKRENYLFNFLECWDYLLWDGLCLEIINELKNHKVRGTYELIEPSTRGVKLN